jgi:hypothetical protein
MTDEGADEGAGLGLVKIRLPPRHPACPSRHPACRPAPPATRRAVCRPATRPAARPATRPATRPAASVPAPPPGTPPATRHAGRRGQAGRHAGVAPLAPSVCGEGRGRVVGGGWGGRGRGEGGLMKPRGACRLCRRRVCAGPPRLCLKHYTSEHNGGCLGPSTKGCGFRGYLSKLTLLTCWGAWCQVDGRAAPA